MKVFPVFLLSFLLLFFVGIAEAGDETFINDNLKANSGNVYTLPAGTYTISDQIQFPENTILSGEVSENGELLTTIILTDNADFARQVPLILMKTGCKIENLHLDGNSRNQPPGIDMGDGYYNGIGAYYEDNIEVRNCWLDNSLGDLIRLRSCTNVNIHDNMITRAGHEAVFLIQCEAARVYNNYIEIRDNTGTRIIDGVGIRIFGNTVNFERYDQDNVFTTASHAFQAEHEKAEMSDIEICGNYVYNPPVSFLWLVDETGDDTENIWIHHNVIVNSGDGKGWGNAGIISSGYGNLLIENNVFDGTHGPAIEFRAYASEWGTSAEATIRNNIFVDSVGSPKGSGGGIENDISVQAVISQNNCYYNNDGENALGCSLSNSDYFTDPRTSQTLCDITWNGERWVISGVEPKELGDVPSGIESDVQKPNIISVLVHGFSFPMIETDLGASATVIFNNVSFDPHSLVEVKGDDLKLIKIEYNGNVTRHFVEKDLWIGNIQHIGSELYLPGQFEAGSLQITVYSEEGYQKVTDVKIIERKLTGANAINPDLFIFIAILTVLGISITRNLRRIYP